MKSFVKNVANSFSFETPIQLYPDLNKSPFFRIPFLEHGRQFTVFFRICASPFVCINDHPSFHRFHFLYQIIIYIDFLCQQVFTCARRHLVDIFSFRLFRDNYRGFFYLLASFFKKRELMISVKYIFP